RRHTGAAPRLAALRAPRGAGGTPPRPAGTRSGPVVAGPRRGLTAWQHEPSPLPGGSMPTYIDDDLDELAEDWDYDEATRPARTVRTARPATVVARSTDRPVTQAQMQMVIGQFN